MYSLYKVKILPLQVRRLLIFNKICSIAKKFPNNFIILMPDSSLAFSVYYSDRSKKYVAYGGIFEYAHTRKEVLEKELDKIYHDEFVVCAITIKNQFFTKSVRTPLSLLKQWNAYVKNRPYNYVCGNPDAFFPVNDELEKDYLPHEYHKHLLAIKNLPLWDDDALT